MPLLDFTDVLMDEDLGGTQITVTRMNAVVGANGVMVTSSGTVRANVFAIVVPVPQKLIQASDGALRDGAIRIATTFALSGGVKISDSAMRQPDTVGWHDRNYEVAYVEDGSGFGAGFIVATANLLQLNPTA